MFILSHRLSEKKKKQNTAKKKRKKILRVRMKYISKFFQYRDYVAWDVLIGCY